MDTELLKGTLSLLILALLKRRPMYGYDIAAHVHQQTKGAFTWKEGSLYPSLHKLEEQKLIEGRWEEKDSGRRRKFYHLTKAGQQALDDKRESWKQLVWAVNLILEDDHGQH